MIYTIQNLRYIVFLIDNKYRDHDGRVFQRIQDAKEFLSDYHENGFFTQAVIGSFSLQDSEYSNIHIIETIGFSKDKKNILQLDMFQQKTTTI